ncbi:hypothetical protein CALVIDRAFT_564782 [Calocera viscosa TUFC12733]|uniref:Uncharacterized protein n=1 Tax=Calocera viscosa (strain TUFC12733) TaxID=1330018 RepID=A0A167L669_CALVF|nr:hypothetical protein CALVIDRAFT_564782 [Calocera viscosa TUFC12733]
MSSDLPLHFASQRDADAHILKLQISELERKKRRSIIEKEHLTMLNLQLAALQSPVYKLPDDLLAHIFELSYDPVRDDNIGWIVSHVSARWRRVAISTPRLWTKITVKRPFRWTRRGDVEQRVIQRAQSCPITLIVSLRTKDPQATLQCARQLVHRTESLSLFCVRRRSLGPTLPLAVTTSLLELSLSGLTLPTFQDWLNFVVGTLSLCPGLRTLEMDDLYCAPDELDIPANSHRDHGVPLAKLEVARVGEGRDFLPLHLFQHTRAEPRVISLPYLWSMEGDEHKLIRVMALSGDNFKGVRSLTTNGRGYTIHGIKEILKSTPRLEQLTTIAASLEMCECKCPRLPLKSLRVKYAPEVEGIRGIINAMDPGYAAEHLVVHAEWCWDHVDNTYVPRSSREELLIWLHATVKGVVEIGRDLRSPPDAGSIDDLE